MTELSKNSIVSLVGGGTATIIKELGRDGQGIVYLVEVCGEKKALKWYLNAPDDKFYRNLQQNIASGAPSAAFLWPEFLTEKQQGSYGYIMKLRPQNYYEFGNFLLAKVSFKSFTAMLSAAMKICNGFMMLHRFGYSYQDLNDGNFFIHPDTGDVLICDNDNVAPEGVSSGILGKARYMAPEVVTGKAMPSKQTDRYSLSVVLFLLFYANHPLEGARVLACPCMTEKYEKQFYGSEPIFIYDKVNANNRPVRGVHNNVLRRWNAFPAILRETFTQEFSSECLSDPNKRKLERQWQNVIQQIRDMLVVCPECKDETFVEDANTPKCMCCGKPFNIAGTLQINDRKVLLTPKTKVYVDMDNKPDIQVINVPGDRYPIQLRNITTNNWVVETPSGKIRSVEPNMSMPVKAGLKVNLTAAIKGVII